MQYVIIVLFVLVHHVLLAQEKDFLETQRYPLPKFETGCFSHNKQFAATFNGTDLIQIWDLNDLGQDSARSIIHSGSKILDIDFSYNDQYIITRTNNKIMIYSIVSGGVYRSFSRSGITDMTFSKDNSKIILCYNKHYFEIIDVVTQTSKKWIIPILDAVYVPNIRQAFFTNDIDDIVYLVDAGFADDISKYKVGIHVNLLSWSLSKSKVINTKELYNTRAKIFPDDFNSCFFTPNKDFLLMSIKYFLKVYSMYDKSEEKYYGKNIYSGGKISKIRFADGDEYFVIFGKKFAQLLEIDLARQINKFRVLKHFLGAGIDGFFNLEDNTLIGFANTKNAIIKWDISTALLIAKNPALYVRKCIYPKTIIELTKYFEKRIGYKNPEKYFKEYSDKKIFDVIKETYNKSIQELCKDIYDIAEDYIDISKVTDFTRELTLIIEGFQPFKLKFKTIEFASGFVENYVNGYYKWVNPIFVLTNDAIYIERVNIEIGGKNIEYDPLNDKSYDLELPQQLEPDYTKILQEVKNNVYKTSNYYRKLQKSGGNKNIKTNVSYKNNKRSK